MKSANFKPYGLSVSVGHKIAKIIVFFFLKVIVRFWASATGKNRLHKNGMSFFCISVNQPQACVISKSSEYWNFTLQLTSSLNIGCTFYCKSAVKRNSMVSSTVIKYWKYYFSSFPISSASHKNCKSFFNTNFGFFNWGWIALFYKNRIHVFTDPELRCRNLFSCFILQQLILHVLTSRYHPGHNN